MGTKRWLAAIGGAVLVAAVGVGAVMAQSDEESGRLSFLDRVAQKLGIERDTLDQAVKDARSDEIDARVAEGDLTQEQADRLKERLDELPADAPFFGGRGLHRAGPEGGFGFRMEFGHGKFGFGLGPGLMDGRADLAAFLGISEDQLMGELTAEGASLASVAESHGKSRDDLIAFLQAAAKERVDAAAAAGNLTQEQADNILEKMSEHLADIVDHEMGSFRPFQGHPPFGRDGDDDGSDDDGAEQNGELEESFRS